MAAALSVSGLSVTEFTFYGFLPRQKGELTEKLRQMAKSSKIAVVHESPHRVIDLLKTVGEGAAANDRERELRPDKEARADLARPRERGAGAVGEQPQGGKGRVLLRTGMARRSGRGKPVADVSLEARLVDEMTRGADMRQAMDTVIAGGEKKNAVYAASLRLKASVCAKLKKATYPCGGSPFVLG